LRRRISLQTVGRGAVPPAARRGRERADDRERTRWRKARAENRQWTRWTARTILPRQYRLSSHVVENLFSNPW